MVGYYQTPNNGGFVWNSNGSHSTFNKPNDILTTEALGINDSGVIVGIAYDGSHIAGYQLKNGIFTDINPPGSTYTYATGISNNGTIVGWYDAASGGTHGFILTETTTPEPASAGLFMAGCLGLVWRAARKRRPQKVAP
jgi:probable HAF family extracellular repeat protein